MSTSIFVNLPVKDLGKSVDFFTRLGFAFDARFTDENATCMIVGDNSFVMLLVETFFTTFTTKPVADASRYTETIVSISAGSRERVDELAEAAFAAGATRSIEPVDMAGMYARSFQDPDGHQWELMHMDPAAVPAGS